MTRPPPRSPLFPSPPLSRSPPPAPAPASAKPEPSEVQAQQPAGVHPGQAGAAEGALLAQQLAPAAAEPAPPAPDRKSTRLNSSHSQISYAVFCLKETTEPNI